MGDLASAVSYAANFPADDPFTVECNWDSNGKVDLSAYDVHELFATFDEVCTIAYKAQPVL